MIFRRRKTDEKRSYTLQDAALAEMLGFSLDGLSADKAREATYFTCMRILTDTMSKLPLKVHKSSADGVQEQYSHYLTTKLALRPNPLMSASDFWKAVEYQRDEYGHSVCFIEFKNGKVENLYPLPMNSVTIWVDDAGIIGRGDRAMWYQYFDGTKEHILFPEEVLHFKGMTQNGLTGMSVKDYLRTTIENAQSGSEYVNKYFKGGLTAKGLLQYTTDIDPTNVTRLKKRFEDMATGLDNVGKILPVPLGFNFNTINSTMVDSQFLELNQLSIRQIAAAFGIKMHQVNDMSDSKYANITEQMDEFYRDTLHPILTMYEQELTYKLLLDKEIKAGYFLQFNVDVMLRTSLKERYEAYKLGIDGGFLAANEARKKENLAPKPGGDQLIVNGTMQPLDKVGMAYDQTAIKGGEDIGQNGKTNTNDPGNGDQK